MIDEAFLLSLPEMHSGSNSTSFTPRQAGKRTEKEQR